MYARIERSTPPRSGNVWSVLLPTSGGVTAVFILIWSRILDIEAQTDAVSPLYANVSNNIYCNLHKVITNDRYAVRLRRPRETIRLLGCAIRHRVTTNASLVIHTLRRVASRVIHPPQLQSRHHEVDSAAHRWRHKRRKSTTSQDLQLLIVTHDPFKRPMPHRFGIVVLARQR